MPGQQYLAAYDKCIMMLPCIMFRGVRSQSAVPLMYDGLWQVPLPSARSKAGQRSWHCQEHGDLVDQSAQDSVHINAK